MILFESESIINRDTYIEIKRHIPTPKEKIIFALRPIGGIMIALGGIMLQFHVLTLMGFIAALAFIVSYPLHLNSTVKRELERVNESTGRYEIKCNVYFLDEIIKIHNAEDDYNTEIKYEHFNRFAETKNLYVLFTRTNRLIAIKKTSILKKTSEDFIPFIKNKCIG